MTLQDIAFKNKKRFNAEYHNFNRIFGLNLGQYWNVITGFDIIKFDERMGTPDGTSCKDWINNKYGQEAVDLIQRLL